MSNDDPWKGWYQAEQPPSGDGGSDATRDMTIRSPMPPSPGRNPGAGGQASWPQQPPSSSSGGGGGYQGGGGYSGGGYQGGAGYQ